MYRIVFDFSERGFGAWHAAAGVIFFVTLGVVQFLYPRQLSSWSGVPPAPKTFARLYLTIVLATAVMFLCLPVRSYFELRDQVSRGEYTVTEGVVKDFKPMPYEGHVDESFTVNGVLFTYSDFSMSSGFKNSRSHGGPIREGLRVRITHVGNAIIRLEVWEPDGVARPLPQS